MTALRTSSLSELHYRLGKMVESRPGRVARTEPEAGAYDSNERAFETIPMVRAVDMATAERLSRKAAEFRAEIGEDRWQQLQREWNEA